MNFALWEPSRTYLPSNCCYFGTPALAGSELYMGISCNIFPVDIKENLLPPEVHLGWKESQPHGELGHVVRAHCTEELR